MRVDVILGQPATFVVSDDSGVLAEGEAVNHSRVEVNKALARLGYRVASRRMYYSDDRTRLGGSVIRLKTPS